MKKKLLILAITAFLFSQTACAASEAAGPGFIPEAEANDLAVSLVDQINQIVTQEAIEQYDPATWEGKALDSWAKGLEGMGGYLGVISQSAVINEEDAVITVEVDGVQRDATVVVYLDAELGITGVETNLKYAFSELMVNASLNTVLGMGTTFVILILIALLISCLKLIPKLQASLGKKTTTGEVTKQAVENTIAQIIEKEEENLVDDSELVAVIAAAIAASEGQATAEGYQVRSIRRVNTSNISKWKQA